MSERAIAAPQKAWTPACSPVNTGVLQRKCACGQHAIGAECDECGKNRSSLLQRFAAGAKVTPAIPPVVHEEVRSPGRPLDLSVRNSMEPRFHQDFSNVRIHTGQSAAESAHAVHARAYTLGSHVVFNTGQYAPGSSAGDRLLAHELTHVVQQRGGLQAANYEESAHERVADRVANQVIDGSAAPPSIPPTGIALARVPDGADSHEGDSAEVGSKSETSERDAGTQPDPIAKARARIAKATHELDRLHGITSERSNDTVAAYDAVNSALKYAANSKDKALIQEAQELKTRFNKVARGPHAGAAPLDQHPAASTQPMTPEEASTVVTAQRGFEVGLNAQAIALKQEEIKGKQNELSTLEDEIKTAKGKRKAQLQEAANTLKKEISAAKARIAVSRPTLIEADPADLAKQKQKLEAQLAQKGTEIQKKKLQRKIETLDEQIRFLTSGKPADEAPLSALQGGKLGHSGQTYVTIQIVSPPPESKVIRTLQARNIPNKDPNKSLHAEDVLLDELNRMPDKGQFKGATMIISGDQEVCPRCFPRVREFAKSNGFMRAVGSTTHAPIITSRGKDTGRLATAKTTLGKISDPQEVRKLEQAQTEAGKKSAADPLKLAHQQTTLFRRLPVVQGGGSGVPKQDAGPSGAAEHPLSSQPTPPKPAVRDAAKINAPARIAAPPSAKPEARVAAKPAVAQPVTPKPPAAKAVAPAPIVPVHSAPPALIKPAAASGPSTTSSTTPRASLVSGADKAGLGGSIGHETAHEHGHGVRSTTSSSFDGKIVTNVEEVPNTSPTQYRVTLTLNLGGKVGAGVSKEGEGGARAGVSGYAAGSLTKSESHLLSKEEADRYLGQARQGTGGAFQELQIAQMVAHNDLAAARAALAQWKSGQASAEAAKHMAEGDISTTSLQATAGGTASGGKGKLGIEFGISKSGELTRTQQMKDGKILYTVSVAAGTSKSLGGSAGIGVGSFGYTREGSEFESRSVTFALDPKDPDFNSRFKEVSSANTVDDLRKLAERRKELAGSTTTGHGSSTGGKTSASVAGFGLSISEGGTFSEDETRDASGITRRYEGASTLGGGFTVAGKTVASSSTTDKFTSQVGPDNKATGETSSTRKESDYGKSAVHFAEAVEKRPVGTLVGIATGDTKLLQEKTDYAGKALTDDSFSLLAELAKDSRAWEKAWRGQGISNLIDWRSTRGKVLAAEGDRNLIAKAIGEYESQGSNRSGIVEAAVSDTGIAFDFPDELADQKPIYDELIVGNPLAHGRELAQGGNAPDAIAELNGANNRLGALLTKVQMQAENISPGALAEMMRRISARRTELRAEVRKLTPSPTTAGPVPAQGQPEAKGATPAPQADAAALAQQNQVIEERNARLSDLIKNCLTLRDREAAIFAKVDTEFAKDEHWYSSHDTYAIREELDSIKKMYPEWDRQLNDLRAIYQERGESPDRASQFAPNRDRWDLLEKKWLKY